MNQRERFLKSLHMEPVDRPPAAVPTQNALVEIMEMSGYRWPDAMRRAEAMAGLAWACHEIGGIESVRVPFDINIEAEAMGCVTRFSEDPSMPPLTDPKKKEDYVKISVPDPKRDGRMPEVIEAVRVLKQKTSDQVPLIAALGTPYELLSTTLDCEDIALSIHEDLDFLIEQLGKMTIAAINYAKELEKAGADALMLVDGTSQNLGPRHFEIFSLSFTKQLIENLTKPAILHICGNSTHLLEQMAASGAAALSIDKPVDTVHAQRVSGGKIALVGKIPPYTLCTGSIKEVLEETEESLKQGLHVISPGCGILPQTPLENLRAYIKRVQSWQG